MTNDNICTEEEYNPFIFYVKQTFYPPDRWSRYKKMYNRAMKKPVYKVFFDTSILLYDHKYPIHAGVKKFVQDNKNNKDIDISFYVPYIVQEEFKKNNICELMKRKDSYNNRARGITDMVSTEVIVEYKPNEKSLERYFEKILLDLHIQVIPTPIKEIDFQQIIEKAIHYDPPFEASEKEKGFKDSIAVETFLFYAKSQGEGPIYVFVCNDKILREYVGSISAIIKNIQVYDSCEQFDSRLKLEIAAKNSEKKIEVLTQAALFAFNDETNPDALFYDRKIKIKEQIYLKYKNLIDKPRIENKMFVEDGLLSDPILHPVDGGAIWRLSTPVFVKEKSDKYIEWKSHVVYSRNYNVQGQYRIGGIEGMSMSYYTYILEFEVNWEAEINEKSEIVKATLLGIEHINTKSRPASLSDVMSVPYLSGDSLTASGIGTALTSGYLDVSDSRFSSPYFNFNDAFHSHSSSHSHNSHSHDSHSKNSHSHTTPQRSKK